MSIKLDLVTPQKEEAANLIKAVADIISNSTNKTVTVEMSVTFNQEKKKKDC